MKPEFLISIIALTISVLSFLWNIWSKLFDLRKKLLLQCFKSGSCTVTLTNIGNKPIYVRRIEIEEKKDGRISKLEFGYHKYSDEFEMNALIPGTWRTIIIETNPNFSLFDINRKEYKKTRILVIEATGKIHKTKWFRQNNFR